MHRISKNECISVIKTTATGLVLKNKNAQKKQKIIAKLLHFPWKLF